VDAPEKGGYGGGEHGDDVTQQMRKMFVFLFLLCGVSRDTSLSVVQERGNCNAVR